MVRKISPRLGASEYSSEDLTPLMQLLRLAWGYKEVNDEHMDKVSLVI